MNQETKYDLFKGNKLMQLNSFHQLAGSSSLWVGTGLETQPLSFDITLKKGKRILALDRFFSLKSMTKDIRNIFNYLYRTSFIYMLVTVWKAPLE